MSELGRQLIQLRAQADTTESSFRKAVGILQKWLKAALNHLRKVAVNPQSASPTLAAAIRDTESILNNQARSWRSMVPVTSMQYAAPNDLHPSQFGERVQADERLTPELRARESGQFAVQGDQAIMDQVAAVMSESGSLQAASERFQQDASLPMPVRIAGLSRVALNYDAQASAARATGRG